jgi:hypothetical protein
MSCLFCTESRLSSFGMQEGMALRTPTHRLRLIMQVTLQRIAIEISVLAAVILASTLSAHMCQRKKNLRLPSRR